VGSEVERAIRAHQAGKQARFEHALDRALELFDLTAAAAGAVRAGCEVLRAREEFCRLFFTADSPAGSEAGLINYFLAFAIAVRRPSRSSQEPLAEH
jgi:hypothetical protein